MKLFVWDFHGVLEKGNEYSVLKITNEILRKNNFGRMMSKKECQNLYGRKWYQYFEYLLPDVDTDTHLSLQNQCFELSKNHPEFVAECIKPNKHALKVLKKISEVHEQILISNTNPEALEMFLKSVKIDRYFLPNKAFGADAHNREHIVKKHQILSEFLEDKKFDEIIYIGDSPEDVELTNYHKGKTYLYAHPGKKHKEAISDFKINQLIDILKEI